MTELNTMFDHVHLLVGIDPQYGIQRLVKAIKGRSSRLLRDEFPRLGHRLPTLWTNFRGPLNTSSLQSAVPRWNSSSSMWLISVTLKRRSQGFAMLGLYIPLAKARGIAPHTPLW